MKRGLFHMFAGLSIPIAALFLSQTVMLISVGIVTLAFWLIEVLRLKYPAVNRLFLLVFKAVVREEETSRLTGASYMLLASLLAVWVFPRDIAVLALSFLAVGDPLATIIGQRWGRRRIFGKTLEGDLACLIACIAVGLVFRQVGVDLAWPTILLGALSATVAQAVSLPINDNLTIPLFAGLVMRIAVIAL
ncbi:MAG TPA: SEC59/DGK1/VTE5 family protein [Dehalococcoidales bacterium]